MKRLGSGEVRIFIQNTSLNMQGQSKVIDGTDRIANRVVGWNRFGQTDS